MGTTHVPFGRQTPSRPGTNAAAFIFLIGSADVDVDVDVDVDGDVDGNVVDDVGDNVVVVVFGSV